MSSKNSGFTIVELLIVIVVVAILAAITVVAYGGIQQRSGNVSRIAEVNKIQKLVRSYVTVHGAAQFKSLLPAYPATMSICLGTGYKDVIPTAAVGCYVNGDTIYTLSSAAVDNALATIGKTTTSYPSFEHVVPPDTWAQSAPILRYDTSNITYIDYMLEGTNANCSNGATNLGSNSEWGPSTTCRLTLDLSAI